jgi:glycosyltransferase involved in cell wall biosynthesis
MPKLSVVIPARNEAENLPALIAGIEAALAPVAPFEIIVVDDASTDDSVGVIEAMCATRPHLRLVRHDRAGGQSAGVHSGVHAARGEVVLTLDGDGQNPPEELPKLAAPLLAPGSGAIGLVAGQRVGRQDTVAKKLASRLANGLRGWLLNDGTRDTGCGLKGFRREAFLALPYFNHMHRYLPALFARDGWQVVHVDVSHRPRGAGRSNYSNIQRALVGVVDLFGVMWLIRRRKKARVIGGGNE